MASDKGVIEASSNRQVASDGEEGQECLHNQHTLIKLATFLMDAETALNDMRGQVWAAVHTLAENEGITFDACLGLTPCKCSTCSHSSRIGPQKENLVHMAKVVPKSPKEDSPLKESHTTKDGEVLSSESESSHGKGDGAGEDDNANDDKGVIEASSNRQVA